MKLSKKEALNTVERFWSFETSKDEQDLNAALQRSQKWLSGFVLKVNADSWIRNRTKRRAGKVYACLPAGIILLKVAPGLLSVVVVVRPALLPLRPRPARDLRDAPIRGGKILLEVERQSDFFCGVFQSYFPIENIFQNDGSERSASSVQCK